jgi:hypothetical protein
MKKRVVVVVAAGAALTVGLAGCSGPKEEPEAPPIGNPPAPDPQPVVPTANPPAPLPTWDEVPSGHPEGATNPPYPVLVVTPDKAHCYKQWASPMQPKGAMTTDRVDACAPAADGSQPCGTEIQCPPEADEVLAGRPTNPSRSTPK